MIHQKQYEWLSKETSPKVIVEAVKLYGTKEIVGKQHSKEILSWAEEVGLGKVYKADETAWCGLYTSIVVKRAGFDVVKDPLWARNWNNFGNKVDIAMLGDILIFVREGGGHVGFYVGEDATCYHVLGGNQSNMVNTTRILKSRCIGIRRCDWKVSQPSSVRVIELAANGAVSTNEA